MRQVKQINMQLMMKLVFGLLLAMAATPMTHAQQSDASLVRDVLAKLNNLDTVRGTESAKSWRTIFDAYLNLGRPPMEIGEDFNLTTIHPKMKNWSVVMGWAESNPKMAEAILAAKSTRFTKIGLPYGRDAVDAKYVRAGVSADIGLNGSLRENQFPYLRAVDTIAAFATAEAYRLLESNQPDKAMELYVALAFVVRQFCDREFLAEKLHFIEMLSNVMENMRDMFYMYVDRISIDRFSVIGQQELPFLRPDRSRLFMPEADRIVSEALIREVFDERADVPNIEKFTLTFAEVQSKDAPMTRFGAAKRWRFIASIHSPMTDSLERLKLIYDDWWRRWRIDLYDEVLLSVPTQFSRTNPIRYAAVIYSLQNLSTVFAVRNTLVAQVNGTSVAAAICAYKKRFGTYPDNKDKTYGQFLRRTSDSDPYDRELKPFRYRLLSSRQTIDSELPRMSVDAGECLLYSLGQNHTDERAAQVSRDGAAGDLLLWPPYKTLARQHGHME